MKNDPNIDCEYMCNESYNCCHPKRNTSWRKLWPKRCLEETQEYMTCDLKKSLWDMLKDDAQTKRQTPPMPRVRPPAPPAPPPKRVFKDNKRVK